MSRLLEYTTRLALAFLNERYRRGFAPDFEGDACTAVDPGAGSLSLHAFELFEVPPGYSGQVSRLEARLDAAHPGSYLLWVPPAAELPADEPRESEWTDRVVQTAARLASGRSGEVRLPVRLALGKVRDEGGYASVTGGLGRYWTDISGRLQGSYFLDSRGLHRLTRDQEERERLYELIALLSRELETGEIREFEHDEAWTLQRIPRGAAGQGMSDGWAIGGAPAGFDPTDGAVIRHVLRKRLAEARDAFAGRPRPWILVLAGAYEYMELENAGPSLRGFDPTLVSALDGIMLVADGEVKPILLNRSLSFLSP